MSNGIQTFLRIKPQTINNSYKITGNTIEINNKVYTLDHIFKHATQHDLYEYLSQRFLASCLQGYNCTFFAYGQTGSGKTYTIQGNVHDPGLVQRSLGFLHSTNCELELSFVEIYNETMTDLLDATKELNIREDPFKGVVVDNLTVLPSKSYEESMELYSRGIQARKTSSTEMNRESSRSHSVFTVYIKSEQGAIQRSSKLSFVDLAGSERLRDIKLEEVRIKETANINKSLLCLGKIIQKLSFNHEGHVSYRDSKLTFLLKDSLGGNCKLIVIGNVNLVHECESFNTLNFLIRARMIKNQPIANSDVKMNGEDLKAELINLDKENQELKTRLALIENQGVVKDMNLYVSFTLSKVLADLEQIQSLADDLDTLVKTASHSDFNKSRKALQDLHKYYIDACKERNKEIEALSMKKRRLD